MDWIDRDAALAKLGVKPQTLYAYVSRGFVSAQSHPEDPRASLYAQADIETLIKKRRRGRGRAAIASAAIAWGDPVMKTAITTVRAGKLIYRGRDAIKLARDATLEEAAAFLWNAPKVKPTASGVQLALHGETGKARALEFLASRTATDLPVFGRAESALAVEGTDLLSGLGSAIADTPGRGLFHQRLGRHWKLNPAGIDVLRRALVLVADHELNPSTFAARIAAATGASLAACALSGCATLTGPHHGEASARALSYLKAARVAGPNHALSELGTRQERLPAMGHTLYPKGDPRATALLRWTNPATDIQRAIKAAQDASGEIANLDMALAAMTLHLELPDDAPFLIFAGGRMVGWIAHAIEQSTSGMQIRPRAAYTGR